MLHSVRYCLHLHRSGIPCVPWQREKMLDVAHDYPKMTTEQQQRVQQRLENWSRMTPYERENIRKKYEQFKALPPERQAALRRTWQEYSKLSEADRHKLLMDAAPEDALGN